MEAELKLLVFDWDGTVMDSEARIVNCLEGAIDDLALESRSQDALRNVIGLGLREAINTLYPDGDAGLHQGLVERYRYHFLTANQTPSELFPGAEAILRTLSAEGYLLAVATGKGRVGLDKVLDETGLGEVFHVTRCADETFSKPHPQMLLEIMTDLDTAPDETLMIGDTEYDMLMAKNAGTPAVAVSYGVHERDRLVKHDPLACVDSLRDLYDWLQTQAASRRSGTDG